MQLVSWRSREWIRVLFLTQVQVQVLVPVPVPVLVLVLTLRVRVQVLTWVQGFLGRCLFPGHL